MTPDAASSSLRVDLFKLLNEYKISALEVRQGMTYIDSQEANTIIDELMPAISQYVDRQISLKQLEILRGFRRRDFVNPDLYETAILDRITELQANTEPPIS